SVNHGNALERLPEIHLDAVVDDLCRTEHFLRHMAVQVLCQVHHPVVVCVCLIELHQRELRVVPRIQTFVAEHTADLIYFLKTTHDQSFQVQLQGNAELQILVQRVEVSLERSRRSPSGICHEHRSLDFHKSFSVQVFADRADDPGTLD